MMSKLFLLVLLLQTISCYCQSISESFTIARHEDGDEVASSLTSANYCSDIQGYLDGSQCKCNGRLTFSLETQRCIDYYNVPRFRFSRSSLSADVSVSVVNIAVDTTDGVDQYGLEFTASPDAALPIAEGLGNDPLPTGCRVTSLEFNTPSGWVTNSFSGFSIVERNSASYLEVTELPTEGVELFQAQFVRTNITCPNNVAGSLMFKFAGSFTTGVCEPNPCWNGGSCVNRLGTRLCFCRDGFAGELCDMPTDDIDRCTCDNDNDGNSDTNDRTCSSFSVIRRDDGDRVNTPLSSVEYCRSIRAYCPDGSCSYCQCEFRLTYRHDLQRCDDYYNECRLRFSRLTLSVDTGVSTVGFAENAGGFEINFEATSSPLPIVQGPANFHLPPGCTVSLLAVNRVPGWITVNSGGFSISQINNDTFLQVNGTPSLGVPFFDSELIRLNITCQGTSYGCLPMKFRSIGDPRNSTYCTSTDPCSRNPCLNSGSCILSESGFVCNCTEGFTGVLCQFINYCASNPCQNGGSCMNGLESHLCFCGEGFAGELCDMPTDDIDRCTCDNDNDGNSDTDDGTCSSFSVVRRDDGDRVNTPLSSVEYCRSIRAYCPDGSCSYCQCEFRLTYRHDLQRCDDYYNECRLRFSRLTLNVDTGVSTVGFAENDEGFEITFQATSSPLPIVQGPADLHLPPGCIVSSLAVNRAAGWITVDNRGFNITQIGGDTFLQVDGTPSLGVAFFDSELVRLNITCQGTSYGCLPMKFRLSRDPRNSTYCTPTDPCSRNPCKNGGTCTSTGDSFNCSCPPYYSGPLCGHFNECSTQPCMNGGNCTDEIDGYSCTCVEGFTGDNCSNGCPCMNGGICSNDSIAVDGNFFFCICPDGFTGDNCETIIRCTDSPCINGMCMNETDGYTCICDVGYTGRNCGEDINECSIEDPCANGVCVNTEGSFMCNCEAGYTGTYCAEAICTNPCINGGICFEPDVCRCPEPYGGPTCAEITCSSDFCANGGTCEESLIGLTCRCPAGFAGERCETRNSALSDRANQDDEALQTGAAVGVSVGLVVVLVGAAGVIVVAIIVYTKYYSRKRKPDVEQDSGMENPTYGHSNSNGVGTNEPVYETVPDNDGVTQNVQNHNETDDTVIP